MSELSQVNAELYELSKSTENICWTMQNKGDATITDDEWVELWTA